jgi:diacylglycerol kinase family enzyme
MRHAPGKGSSVITVFLNPKAGVKQVPDVSAHLASLFETAGLTARIIPLEFTSRTADAVRAAVAEGADAVVAAGGDGTVSSVANALAGSDTPLGVLPLGTLNHFAKDLQIPLDLRRAVHVIAQRHAIRVDVGEVKERLFVNNSSIGLYPNIIVARDELRRAGYRKWTALALASAKILRRYRGVTVRITRDGSTTSVRTPFLFIGNNEYVAEGIGLGARVRLDEGRLYAYLAPRLHARDLPKLFALSLIGRAKEGTLKVFAADELDVTPSRSRTLKVALDGEVIVMTSPLHYRARPRGLEVLVPAR